MTCQTKRYFTLGILNFFAFFVFAQDKIIVNTTVINSTNSEYAPVYYNNGLVFSSVSSNDDPNKSMTGLYFAPFKKNKFGKKSIFSPALKTGLHEGAITFSSDGKTAYFTRTQNSSIELADSITQDNKLGIFKATYNGNDWSNITPCNFNTPEFSFGHPSLTTDGKRLYFASDIEGGFGGKDIYYVEIKNGICGPLINLGENINTANNELFPSITDKGALYFSSDRTGGNGGLDIYSSSWMNNQWSAPKLLDNSINSEFDDFSIVWNSNGTEGYFASNRNGSDDIFKIIIEYPPFENCVEIEHEQLCYDFYEEATVYVDTVEMIYEWDFGDGSKDNSLGAQHCYEKTGKYHIQLSILDKILGEKYKELAAYNLEIKEVIQPLIIMPDSFVMGKPFDISVKQGKWKEYPIENFYIDYGDGTVEKNNGKEHQYSSSGEKVLSILITGRDPITNENKKNCFSKTINIEAK